MNDYLVHFIISLAMISSAAFTLGCFALLRGESKFGVLYGWYSLSVVVWSLFQMLMIMSESANQAFTFAKISTLGVLSLPVLLLSFNIEFYGLRNSLFVVLRTILMFLSGFFAILLFSSNHFLSVHLLQIGAPFFFIKPLFGYKLFLLYFTVTISISVFLFGFYLFFGRGFQRKLSLYFFSGAMLAYVGAANNFFLAFDKVILPWAPFGNYGVFINFILQAYALFYYKYIEIESVVKLAQNVRLITLGHLAAAINHEIKSPVYAIKSLSENYLNEENCIEGSPLVGKAKREIEMFSKIRQYASRILKIIEGLTRVTRPTLTKKRGVKAASVRSSLNNALEILSYQLNMDGIVIVKSLGQEDLMVSMDDSELEEVLINIILNSHQAMKDGGRLTVAVSGKNKTVQISISDTGCGMSKQAVRQLFQPFCSTKNEAGTGLGLFIMKQILEQNGGTIIVKSEPNKGTHFDLEIPRAGA